MHILIFGASGHVGTGLARLLADDHRVTGVVRSQPGGDPAYRPLVQPDWVELPRTVVDALTGTEHPRVDAVIAAIGGWYVGEPMLSRGLAAFDEDYSSYLRGHFSACAVSEALAEAGAENSVTHLALNGVASVEACVGSGDISVFGAAQEMLLRVAAAETSSVNFRELKVMAPIGGDDRNDLSGGVRTVELSAVAEAVSGVFADPGSHELSTELRP